MYIYTNIHLVDVWFQQNGATRHISRDKIKSLREKFNDPAIPKIPPKSCNVTPFNFLL